MTCSATLIFAALASIKAYPAAASSPLSSTRISSNLPAWLCGFDQELSLDPSYSYVPLLPNLIPHLQTLLNFVTNTLPKPLASKILLGIGADSWDNEDGVDNGWEDRPTLTLTRILLTYRQLIFVTVLSPPLVGSFIPSMVALD
ncbi:uncharacterized protein EV420DRAFT_1715790 [Desarmillaria tabescens]|uniref:Chitinase n=1 Tax=Armillaria tabescens TaxID=1929756 RepID=A0AA39JP66_ARMTA|nr:uncharacterized protein EV420DRAFT_1715790 [Desarmillaria tabescens]KAK0446377.1 hypothetical protein EV420DRAFT_1715790 [Desarmillaria tabescens]